MQEVKQRGISVSQLNNYVKQVFDAEEMLHNLEVYGEIDGLKINGNMAFFSLKDKDAVISCACYAVNRLKDIKNGSNVIVRGTVGYWNKVGKISFTVTSCELFGLGQLYLQFLALKEKLEKQGLFAKKRQLPQDVARIGVVTSRTGAVLHDIVKIVKRRNPYVTVVLYPVKVQGAGAEKEIAEGIRFFCDNVDCVIVARGGGSSEDLSAFNSEEVARAAFECKLPIISAVGHETDTTLIDYVADMRAPTPSAAAEIVVREYKDRATQLKEKYRLLQICFNNNAERNLNRLVNAKEFLTQKMQNAIQTNLLAIDNLSTKFELLNPLAILKKGYGKLYKNDEPIESCKKVEINDIIDIEITDGKIKAEVKDVVRRKN